MSRAIERAESVELKRLQAEVDALVVETANLQIELTERRRALAEFEQRYRATVAPLLARVEALEAELVPGQDQHLKEPQARAARAAKVAEGFAEGTPPIERPDPALRDQYKRLAKQCHPDLATDETDRKRRAALMVDLNHAWASGDAPAMARLAREADKLPQGEDTDRDIGQRLVDLLRYRAAMVERARDLRAEFAALESSALEAMRKRAEQAQEIGDDFLANLAAELRVRIDVLVQAREAR